MTSRTLSLALSATLAGAALFAAPASAEIERYLQLDVQYDASVLGTASGAETVLKSVQDQATVACRYTRPVAGAPRVDDACVSEIIAQAVARIDAPELTRIYAASTEQPASLMVAQK
ncbi:UrcA family protein [Hyphomonas sp.]|uniref:UrcA family protein n=1 Tax=Hyphomonas sp. TaxID=87 RepID=UPI003527A1F3